MTSLLDLSIELFFGFIALLLAVKIIGRRHVQQVSPFDFISAIVMGELLGNAIYDGTTIWHVLYAIGLWALLLYVIERITQKSCRFRNIIEGSPVLLIKKGIIDFDVLKREKLDFTELLSLLRNKDVFSVREVEYAIIEPSGVITVIKKTPYHSVSKSDLRIAGPASPLNLAVILDGKIDRDNLNQLGYDENWLKDMLLKQHIYSFEDVLYAEWDDINGLFVQQRKSVPPKTVT